MKKILSIILAILMIVTTVPMAFAAEGDTEGKTIVITMNDSYGDGWDGNAISVERIVDGEFVLVDTATFDAGETETYSTSLSNDGIYAFRWIKAFASVECSFEIAVDGEVVYKSSDVGSFEDGKLVYVLCEHNFVQSLCSVCKLECGTDFDHKKSDDGSCAICGKFIYEITHQPTATEAYVKLNNSEKVAYQWLVQSGFTETPITDENAEPFENYYKSYYDSDSGWFGCDSGSHTGVAYFIIPLRKGDKVTVNIASHSWEKLGFYDIGPSNNSVEVDYVEGVTTYSFEIKKDGSYIFEAWATGLLNGHTGCPLTATISRAKFIPIEGETSAELQNPVIGNSYACRATCGDAADVLTTEAFEYVYTISHQPTTEETYVELNEDAGATYQWYKLGGDLREITDENASGNWKSIDDSLINSVYKDGKWVGCPYEDMQFYFMVDMKAGEKLNVELSEPVDGVGFSLGGDEPDFVAPQEPTKASFIAEEDGNYWFITLGMIDYISAYIGDVEYVPVEGQTGAVLEASENGKYVCDVTFADGTSEMSKVVEMTMSHICDFSGEWNKNDYTHWKKCAVDGCSKRASSGEHIFTDGNCECGYECTHESYVHSVCEKCGVVCTHEVYGELPGNNEGIKVLEASNPFDACFGKYLFDGDAKTKWYSDCLFMYKVEYVIFSYSKAARIKSYTLVPAEDTVDHPARNWTAWTIYGTNDLQGEWTVVHSVVDANLPLEGESEVFAVDSEKSYMYYKLVVDGTVDNKYHQMGDININAELRDVRKCDECGYVCIHEDTLVKVDAQAPTCTEIGWDAYEYCTACDYTTYKEIPASHKIEKVDAKAPTCTEIGWDAYEYCTACTYTTYVEKGTLDHSLVLIKTTPAECGVPMVDFYNCEFCYNFEVAKPKFGTELFHSFTKYEVIEEAKCGVAGKKVAVCDNGCGETDEKAIEALEHSLVLIKTTPAECGVPMVEFYNCEFCCDFEVAKPKFGTELFHSFTKYEITEAPTCNKAGEKAAPCDNGCGEIDVQTVPALDDHVDADGDYKCDFGCGHEFEKPAPEEPTPDTPDEPTDDACDHLCHKGGFMSFIWKIVRFFSKLFKINPVCECGAAHY